jgi:hypothetical protein
MYFLGYLNWNVESIYEFQLKRLSLKKRRQKIVSKIILNRP